jgi:hypothetical protein
MTFRFDQGMFVKSAIYATLLSFVMVCPASAVPSTSVFSDISDIDSPMNKIGQSSSFDPNTGTEQKVEAFFDGADRVGIRFTFEDEFALESTSFTVTDNTSFGDFNFNLEFQNSTEGTLAGDVLALTNLEGRIAIESTNSSFLDYGFVTNDTGDPRVVEVGLQLTPEFTAQYALSDSSILADFTSGDSQGIAMVDAGFNVIPEPGSLALLAAGTICIIGRRRRA